MKIVSFARTIFIVLLSMLISLPLNAQKLRLDSVSGIKIYKQDYKKIAFVAAPILVTGVATKLCMPNYSINNRGKEEKFNAFSVTEFAPGAIMLGMKAFGVESRSSWGRMLTADAVSGLLTVGIVESLKRGVGEERPNGVDHRSFPSGHSALAFMTATMMAREYGWKSPWYTVGAYSLATATAMSRVVQNYHWAGDVLSGAGIGIMATQLGYFVSDLIFKDKGLSKNYIDSFDENIEDRRFELLINSGIAIPLNDLNVYGFSYNLATGTSASIEGNYWINRWLGAKLSGQLQSLSLSRNLQKQEYLDPLSNVMVTVGPVLRAKLCNGMSLYGSVGAGYSHYFSLANNNLEIKTSGSSIALCGQLGVKYRFDNNFSFGVNAGYNGNQVEIKLPIKKDGMNKWLNALAIDFSTEVAF